MAANVQVVMADLVAASSECYCRLSVDVQCGDKVRKVSVRIPARSNLYPVPYIPEAFYHALWVMGDTAVRVSTPRTVDGLASVGISSVMSARKCAVVLAKHSQHTIPDAVDDAGEPAGEQPRKPRKPRKTRGGEGTDDTTTTESEDSTGTNGEAAANGATVSS